MIRYSLFFFFLFNTVFVSRVLGQTTGADQSSEKAAAYITDVYNKAIGKQSQLYRGPAYDFYDANSIGSPYFNESAQFSNGSVVYNGMVYKNTPLLYDQFKRILVTLLYDNFSKLSLLNNYVSEFYLYDHHFIRLQPDEQNPKLETDFYDQLYTGKLQLFVKRYKSQDKDKFTGKIQYQVRDTYYVKKNKIYYLVNSNGQLWDVLEDKKKELKRYAKDKKLDLSNDRDHALLMLVTYYDQTN